MTLGALHQRFLQHCAVEKRLRPMTIASYRSDFGLFLEFLRLRARGRRARADTAGLRSFTTSLIRDYQEHMATKAWSINTVRRRLVELNRFAGWLVERRHLQRSPMIGVSVPRRERRLPRVLDWSQVEQIVAGERNHGQLQVDLEGLLGRKVDVVTERGLRSHRAPGALLTRTYGYDTLSVRTRS